MNLTWHLARKDLRRFAAPVAVWLALLVGPLVAFRFFVPNLDGHMASSLEASVRIASIWTGVLVAVQGLIGYALAGALVLEDSQRGTTAFWKTRPISRGRLIGAKALAGGVAFIVAPPVALAAVWLTLGFDGREIGVSAWAFTTVHGSLAAVAFVLALITRHLAQLFLFTLALGVGFFGLGIVARPALMRVNRTDEPHVAPVIRAAERPEDRAAEIVPEATMTKFSPRSLPTLFVAAPWTGDRGYVPGFARLTDGSLGWGATGPGAVQAGLRTLGFKRETELLRWQIQPMGRLWSPDYTDSLTGTLEVWAGRMRVVGEMPVRVGSVIVEGAERTRIVGLERGNGNVDTIFIEERDAAATAATKWAKSNLPRRDTEGIRSVDSYYLVNRAAGAAHGLSVAEIRGLELTLVSARYRRLNVPRSEVWDNAVLIKLRFEIERRFDRPLDVRGVTLWERGTTR